MLGSRILSVGSIRPRSEIVVDIHPPMRSDEHPLAIHFPGGALVILDDLAPDQLRLRNTIDHAVNYTLILVPRVGVQLAQVLARFVSR